MYALRDYQKPDPIWQYFRERKGDGKTHNPLCVLPTGAGKSIVIAAIIKDMLEKFGGRRVLVLTHQKELLAQNHEKLVSIYPECDPGIYSASLGKKQTDNKVLFCGIQSVHNKAHKLGDFSLIVIDECHTLPKSGTGMYLNFINEMNKICGKVPVIGLTATPFRLDSGYLHKGEGALFTGIAHEVSINELLERGYLCPLTTKHTSITIDVSGVHKRGGEFIADELAIAADAITEQAIDDALPKIATRNTGLVFCVTVSHAEHVSSYLNANGVTCAVIHGKTASGERDRLLTKLRNGEIKCLANVNCLTTGVDVPNIDFLIMLRPTQSPGMYAQMGGRGMRIHESKKDCLVLDYAGNIARHGPIDAIQIRDKSEGSGDGEAPIKCCPECESIVHASVRECPDCGFEFPPPALKVEKHASKAAILSKDYEPEWRKVDRVTYSRHPGKDGKPDTMRVDYFDDSGLFPVKVASEFVCVFHPLGWAKTKAEKWWNDRCYVDCENKIKFTKKQSDRYVCTLFNFDCCIGAVNNNLGGCFESLISIANQFLDIPTSIQLDTRGKYATIVGYKFDDDL